MKVQGSILVLLALAAMTTATTYEDNLASITVMKKLNMQFERRYRLDADDLAAMDTATADPGEPFPGDDVEYAILRSQWSEKPA